MERDFMGLNSKDSLVVVKEEAVESCKDSGFRWPSSSKVSALPHFMSFKSAQDDITLKVVSDGYVPPGFGSLSIADAIDAGHKHQSSEIQNGHAVHLSHDVKMLPFPMSIPSYKNHFSSTGQNFAPATMKQQFLGGIPVTAPHSIFPSNGFVAATTEPWYSSKNATAPAQLTIFYGGAVNIFDDISPEKAQAIMFLAGNGCISPNVVQPRFQVQGSTSKIPAVDRNFVNRTPNSLPPSGISSPMSVSSHPIGQSGGSSPNKDETKSSKTANVSVHPASKMEPSMIVASLGPVGATTIMPAAVPQARKASLARFLEKRKERVMSSSPYSFDKKSNECSTRL